MKKLFSAFTVVLLAFCFISCAPQEFSDSSSKNNGSVSLLLNAARTISPASGVSYLDVSEWTLTFQDITNSRAEKYNNITQTVSFENNKNVEIPLPSGTYKIILEGSAQGIPFYGEDSVTVEKNQTVYKSVCVAPKKSDKGTGSFDFTVNISGLENYPNSVFESKLIPYPQGEEKSLSSSFSNSKLTITAQDILSGYYTLSIKCTWGGDEASAGQSLTKEIFYPYHDFLVEIIDGLTTTGLTDITVSLEESKTYYATIGTSKGNGAFASMPKNLDALLEEIDSSVFFVNIYMVDENPSIDVSRIRNGITYNIYNKNGTQLYSIYAETEQIPSVTMFINNITLSGGQANLIYSGSEETSEINCTLKKNASVLVDSPTTINIQNLEYSDYYVKNPCVIMQNPDNNSVNLSGILSALYEVTTVPTGTEIYYYITPVQPTPSQTDGFVLYDNTSDATQPLLFYAAFSDEGLKSQPLIEKNSSLKIIDYCFDLTNNLYALVENSASYSVYKYNNVDKSCEKYSLSAQDIKNIQCIECSGSSLYAVVETPENEYFAKLTLDDLLKIVKVEQYELTQWISSTHNDIKTFCVDETNLYAVAAFLDLTITKTAIFTATIDETNKTITMGQYIPLAEVNQSTSQSSSYQFDNYGTNLEYRDLCCINENLYLLIRDVQQPKDSAEAITSRGAVCIYQLSNNNISQGKTIGYQNQGAKISYTSDAGSNSTTERQTYIGNGTSTFCGPVKFVSFNESALFIADNGFSLIEEAYSQNKSHTQCTATSKNSIVTFDLSLNDLSFTSLSGECFDKNYSGYFYGTSFTGNE